MVKYMRKYDKSRHKMEDHAETFETLGAILKDARARLELTSSQVIEQTGLKASPALYSYWENNKKLPIPQDLRRLCQFLGVSLESAFSHWAAAQMPTPALKQLFIKAPSVVSKSEPVSYPSSVTVVLREVDAEWFTEYPLSIEILIQTLMDVERGGSGLTAKNLASRLKQSEEIVSDLCRMLVTLHYLMKEGSKFLTPPGAQYLYVPETEAFEPLRRKRLLASAGRILEQTSKRDLLERKALRFTQFKRIPSEKVTYFIDRIEAISEELATCPTDKAPQGVDDQYYRFICLFAPENKERKVR
jgi:transcriptional regulator with XRE-family HTH domain